MIQGIFTGEYDYEHLNVSQEMHKTGRRRPNRSSRARERKQLKICKEIDSMRTTPSNDLFDYILVDSECTHDGSYRRLVNIITSSYSVATLTSYVTCIIRM